MNSVPGNPFTQQRSLLAGESFVSLNKSVLEIRGTDRLTWLNDIFSQKIDDLTPGDSTEALWLDMQGRILRDVHLIATEESVLLITFSEGFEDFVQALKRMVFRSQVELIERPELKVVASFVRPVSAAVYYWQDPWPLPTQGGWRYSSKTGEPWPYFESLMSSNPELLEAGQDALAALRIAAYRPAGPNEIDERSIPHELDWLTTAVHLNKGCYRGQETVAKVHNLGAPPRKLVFLHLDGSGHLIPQSGAEISSGEVIGKITSVASHFQAGPIALGLVKRNFKGGTVEVKLEDGSLVSATLEEIVPSDAGGVVDLGEFRKPRA